MMKISRTLSSELSNALRFHFSMDYILVAAALAYLFSVKRTPVLKALTWARIYSGRVINVCRRALNFF